MARIADCRAEDVAVLDVVLPSASVTANHAQRYARQLAGVGTYLIAWRDGHPVGACEVRWDGCAAPEVREVVGNCPEINGLFVWPESLRSQGIGTAFIRTAEDRARERGVERLGLGVTEDNVRAAALYRRLGYRPVTSYVDRYTLRDAEGVPRHMADPCAFMVTTLGRTA
ncbi:GNAT family N-acetyltransferase [Streptomyces litchfieldiae]|uniref:GNAT family N-acetyltransferase n=1 Tax=Streptomyces litchfieldiae TaxID=3075543 RepID=A0ABU2MIW9_9ACTN|nr:GNAT family N-acetyltransferase [Streptomyces sp. DSM 44938]MDT0341470.1 GNAT family N-acetyltransferase [Streptomyces sp. DSM 44938]